MSKQKRHRNVMLTFFNYDIEKLKLKFTNLDKIKCYAFQEETCPRTYRDHIQAYCEFKNAKTFSSIKKYFGDKTVHIEPRKHTKTKAINYCTKENTRKPDTKPYTYNTEIIQGTRDPFDQYFIKVCTLQMSVKDFRIRYPKYYFKNIDMIKSARRDSKRIRQLEAFVEHMEAIELRPWQKQIYKMLLKQNDREVIWVYEPDTKKTSGKTLLCQYIQAKHPDDTIIIRGGKHADIMEAYDYQDNIIFDFGRSREDQTIPYSLIEELKDGTLFKRKYRSKSVIKLGNKILVVANTPPEVHNLTLDRWKIYELSNNKLTKIKLTNKVLKKKCDQTQYSHKSQHLDD